MISGLTLCKNSPQSKTTQFSAETKTPKLDFFLILQYPPSAGWEISNMRFCKTTLAFSEKSSFCFNVKNKKVSFNVVEEIEFGQWHFDHCYVIASIVCTLLLQRYSITELFLAYMYALYTWAICGIWIFYWGFGRSCKFYEVKYSSGPSAGPSSQYSLVFVLQFNKFMINWGVT